MKAVIMAGGEGTRLRPLTNNQPKPMLPMANAPMMEHIVSLLARHGFDDIVVTLAYLPNHIRNYFGDGSEFGVRIRYATEDSPLGTAGSVRNAAAELDETFLVISGDVLTDVNLTDLVAAHHRTEAVATIGLVRVEDPVEFGIVMTQEDGTIDRFLEKPTWGQVFSDTINTGIYVLEPSVFSFIPEDAVVDFSGDVFPALLAHGLRMHGEVLEGYWEDVGTLDAYISAHQDILRGDVEIGIEGFSMQPRVWVGEGAELDPSVKLHAPVVIGKNSRIESGVIIEPFTVIGDDVVIKSDTIIERSVIHDHVYIGSGTVARGAIVGRNTNVRAHVRLEEGSVIGDECFLGSDVVVNPGVRIYPFKTVESGATVTSSIIWESRGARTLFGRRGVRGLANVDVTPELAVRLAMAYGTTLERGSHITISRDTSRAARSMKRAIIGGLTMAGITVEDVELATVPLTRFATGNSSCAGGITVRLDIDDPESIEIRFFDRYGADIDESAQRKIDRLIGREEFRRAFAGDIGDIVFPPRTLEFYVAALARSIDMDRLATRRFKIVLDYSYSAVSLAMPAVLAKAGADVLAINPFAATAVAERDASDLASRTQRVSDLVVASAADLGVCFDPSGETATLVDECGRVLTTEDALLVLVTLVAQAHPGVRIGLPVSASREAERIARRLGAEIVWTKLSAAHLMEVARGGDVDFAASQEGGFIWSDFFPAYDATATLLRLLDLLAASGERLSALVEGLSRCHIAHQSVATPWELKGTVMRAVLELAKDRDVLLVDGVKIALDNGWVLVLPDPELPVTHVWSECDTEAEASRLAQEYARRIEEFVRNPHEYT
jgi:mannose-1-phosphate guanylyltransferase/phosphomannomutase